MNNQNKQLEKKFLLKWVAANGIGWLVGSIGAFVLSYLVVNIFYPKETNLILGLCIGAGIGYAQWFVLKGMFRISSLWGLLSSICLGIPFIAFVLMDENGYKFSSYDSDYEFLYRLLFGLIMGFVIGLLQMKLLKPYFKKPTWWIAASTVGWGICLLATAFPMPFATLSFLFGGVILGIITGYGLIWMHKISN